MNKRISLLLLLAVSLSLSGCFRTRADIAREKEEREMKASIQQSVVEHNMGLEQMQREIGRLQGKIEEIEHQRKREQFSFAASSESQSKTVADLKARLEEMQKSQAVLFDEIKRLREENVQMLKTLAQPAPARKSPAPASTGNAGGQKKNTASYDSALTAFKAKDYEAAASGFRAYLQANPGTKRRTSAQFHIGDSLFFQKKYADAIVEFAAIHERSPNTPMGRRSTLRIAESFKAMGKDKDARAFAQLLVQGHPDSAEAKQARKFLR